jgi:hypothetical protein
LCVVRAGCGGGQCVKSLRLGDVCQCY